MKTAAKTTTDYIDSLPDDRKNVMNELRQVINKNLPKGFSEGMGYGMPGWCVPHASFPAGYHCDPEKPLPFMSIAAQKNFIALYHMGIYCDPKMLKWFTDEFPKHSKSKLDMGKSCIRFKKMDDIPFKLIGELVKKMTPEMWVKIYTTNLEQAQAARKKK